MCVCVFFFKVQNTLKPQLEGKDTIEEAVIVDSELEWPLGIWIDWIDFALCFVGGKFMLCLCQCSQLRQIQRIPGWEGVLPEASTCESGRSDGGGRWGKPQLCLQLLRRFHWKGYSWSSPGRISKCPPGRGQWRGPKQRGQPKQKDGLGKSFGGRWSMENWCRKLSYGQPTEGSQRHSEDVRVHPFIPNACFCRHWLDFCEYGFCLMDLKSNEGEHMLRMYHPVTYKMMNCVSVWRKRAGCYAEKYRRGISRVGAQGWNENQAWVRVPSKAEGGGCRAGEGRGTERKRMKLD